MANLKFSGFTNGGALLPTDGLVGLRSGVNTKFLTSANSSNVFYFGTSGDDSSGNGTLQFPFATRPAAATAALMTATATNCTALCQLPGGIIDQGSDNIYVYPFVFDINFAPASVITTGFTGIRTTGQILLDASWGTTANCQYYNYGTNWYADYIYLDCQFNTACNVSFKDIYWSTTNGFGNNYIKNGLIMHSKDCVITAELRMGDDPDNQTSASAAYLYDDGSSFDISIYQGVCVSNNYKGQNINVMAGLQAGSLAGLRITNAQMDENAPIINAFLDDSSLATCYISSDSTSLNHNSSLNGKIIFIPLTINANLAGATNDVSFSGTVNLSFSQFQYMQLNILPAGPGGEVILPNVQLNPAIPLGQSRLITTPVAFTLKDFAGTILYEMPENTVIRLTLLDNFSAEGNWLLEPLIVPQTLIYSVTLNGAITSTPLDLIVTVENNRFVSIFFPSVVQASLIATAQIDNTPVLPVALRPAVDITMGFDIVRADVVSRGAIKIFTTGLIIIGVDYVQTPFTISTPDAGFSAQVVQYDLLATS